jgi:hypothetical protein
MQISEAAGGAPAPGAEPCRFPKLEECAHFHYERVQLPKLTVTLQTNIEQSLHSQHANDDDGTEWFMVQVTSGDECWLLQRNFENFKMLDDQLHQCIYDRKIFQLLDLSDQSPDDEDLEVKLKGYLERFSDIADNSVNCGPVLNWLQMDNKGHRLLVPSEESRSINTPAVAAAYSVRRYVSQVAAPQILSSLVSKSHVSGPRRAQPGSGGHDLGDRHGESGRVDVVERQKGLPGWLLPPALRPHNRRQGPQEHAVAAAGRRVAGADADQARPEEARQADHVL